MGAGLLVVRGGVGRFVGELVALGVADGVAGGVAVGVADGEADGVAVGVADGVADGVAVGVADGELDGVVVGVADGGGVVTDGEALTDGEAPTGWMAATTKPVAAGAGSRFAYGAAVLACIVAEVSAPAPDNHAIAAAVPAPTTPRTMRVLRCVLRRWQLSAPAHSNGGS